MSYCCVVDDDDDHDVVDDDHDVVEMVCPHPWLPSWGPWARVSRNPKPPSSRAACPHKDSQTICDGGDDDDAGSHLETFLHAPSKNSCWSREHFHASPSFVWWKECSWRRSDDHVTRWRKWRDERCPSWGLPSWNSTGTPLSFDPLGVQTWNKGVSILLLFVAGLWSAA